MDGMISGKIIIILIHNMKISLKFFLLAAIIISNNIFAQGYIFFSDSPNSSYYDPSYGFYNNPSIVVLTNSTKCPVDTSYKYSGSNSLRLRWKSIAGGEWGLAVAEDGWVAHDATIKDSITFRVYTSATIDSAALPSIYIEDLQNNKTPKQKLSHYINGIQKDIWTKVVVPLSIFKTNPGSTDLTQIKTIYFGQDNGDGNLHTIYLDDIRMIAVSDTDYTPPSVPKNLTASGYHSYIHLSWTASADSDLAGYYIYRSNGNGYSIILVASRDATYLNNNTGIPPKTFSYKISAFDLYGNESALSDSVTASTTSASDSVLLDIVQEATFKYFWDYAHPTSGLARERLGSGDVVTTGGSGFGVMAILVGIERGFITRVQGVGRILTILNFLSTKADRFHGVFPHWMNGNTGKVIPFSTKDNGGDLVETAFMIQGLLTARQYFNLDNSNEQQIRELITSIWEDVEWDWYRKDNGNFLYWHWSPNYNWDMNFPLRGPNETMITYLLGIASPTHPIPASLYHDGWASSSNYLNGKSFYGIPLYVGWDYGGPLFFAHYSFLGFDPRFKKDAYTNYFINNKNHSLIQQAYSISNPKHFPGYDADTWGLTASDDPNGYLAHEISNDNGTISPTAALSSMPYTPKESIDALKSFYYEYGGSLWGTYGFKDAFNLKVGWYADSYLAIDEGPIIDMIENYRSQLLWKNFMANPEIQPMLDAIGFVPDSTSTDAADKKSDKELSFKLAGNYPNPFNPITTIEFSIPSSQQIKVVVFDILGREIKSLINDELNSGTHKIIWDGKNNFGNSVNSGIYIYKVKATNKILTGKMILQK